VTIPGTYRDWPQYLQTVYGFSFSAPPGWTVREWGANFIKISPAGTPDIHLLVGVRWADEYVQIQRTGVPAGDLVRVGEVHFLGRDISKDILVLQGRDKAVLYNMCVEISVGERVFTLGLGDSGLDYDSVDFTTSLEETVDEIVASFSLPE
jgi:hypothetical protein